MPTVKEPSRTNTMESVSLVTGKGESIEGELLFEQANVLLDQYAIHKIQENDIGFTRKSTLDPLI